MIRRYLSTAILGAALIAPAIARADDHDKHHRVDRYYDSRARDYHEWNENEERAYRHWVEQERHEAYRDWKHAKKRDREAYWRWRHAHEDWH